MGRHKSEFENEYTEQELDEIYRAHMQTLRQRVAIQIRQKIQERSIKALKISKEKLRLSPQ